MTSDPSKSPVSWRSIFKTSFKRIPYTLLRAGYATVPTNIFLGIGLILMPFFGQMQPELSLWQKITTGGMIFAIGIFFCWFAVWAFRRGPHDLSRGSQIFVGILTIGLAITSPFFFEHSESMVVLAVAIVLMTWGVIIFRRIPKKETLSNAPIKP